LWTTVVNFGLTYRRLVEELPESFADDIHRGLLMVQWGGSSVVGGAKSYAKNRKNKKISAVTTYRTFLRM